MLVHEVVHGTDGGPLGLLAGVEAGGNGGYVGVEVQVVEEGEGLASGVE